ncbi:basic salivary proline-rich protein 3-like [Canis lupus dingo]|uniref:basic salivary proline-rich protein 3-like n=1 Tax=Canis lupus dingo TaxID=286419 RepID=UPI0020C4D994|nr:basic salivary proline-rich protein 3-like [Canis lupus dingo]
MERTGTAPCLPPSPTPARAREVEGHARQRQPHRESPPGPDARTDGPPTPRGTRSDRPGPTSAAGLGTRGENRVRRPGPPHVPAAGSVAPPTGFLQAQTGPRRQGVTTGDNRVTRKAGPKIARSHRTDGGTHPVPRPEAAQVGPRGRRRSHRRVLVDPPRRPARPPPGARRRRQRRQRRRRRHPRSSGGPISGERIARRGPGDSRTLAPEPPSSWNSAPGNRHQSCSLPVAAEPPEGTRSIKAAARWHPTTGANDSGTDPGGEAVRAPRISPLGPGTAEGPGAHGRAPREPRPPGAGEP